MSKKKWTNERIDLEVASRCFRRITDVTTINHPSTSLIRWHCDICSYAWNARVDNVVGKRSGCPSCAGNLPYTIEMFRDKLVSLGRTDLIVERLINGYSNPTQGKTQRRGIFVCVKCNNRWAADIHNIIKFRYGCPPCNDNVCTRVVDSLGNKFHSKLEYYFWQQYEASGLPFQLIRQQRYSHDRRLTCDYVIPSLKLWIEVSGGSLLKQEKYSKTLAEKKAITVARGHEFMVLSSFAQIDNCIKTIRDINVVKIN